MEVGEQGEGQESVGDGGFKRAILGFDRVHVDPLAVIGAFGEGVDPGLGHFEPVRNRYFFSHRVL